LIIDVKQAINIANENQPISFTLNLATMHDRCSKQFCPKVCVFLLLYDEKKESRAAHYVHT